MWEIGLLTSEALPFISTQYFLEREALRKKVSFTLEKENKQNRHCCLNQLIQSLIRCSRQFFSWSPFTSIGWGIMYSFFWGLIQVSMINLENQTGNFSFWHILNVLINKYGIYWGLVWFDKILIYSIVCNFILSWPSLSPGFLSIFRYFGTKPGIHLLQNLLFLPA